MSVFFQSGAYLHRTTNLLDVAGGDATICLWINHGINTPSTGKYRSWWGMFDTNTGTYTDWLQLRSANAAKNARVDAGESSSGVSSAVSSMSDNTRYFIAIVKSGTSIKYYKASQTVGSLLTLVDTVTKDLSAAAFAEEVINNDFSTNIYSSVEVGWVRQWTAALTEAEIKQERCNSRAQKTANLHLDTPLELFTDFTDVSGNGYDWTAVDPTGGTGGIQQAHAEAVVTIAPPTFLSVTSVPDTVNVTAADFNNKVYENPGGPFASNNGVYIKISGVSGYVGARVYTPGVTYTLHIYEEGDGLVVPPGVTFGSGTSRYIRWTADSSKVYWLRVRRPSSAAAPADFDVEFFDAVPTWYYDEDVTTFPYSRVVTSAEFNALTEFTFRVVTAAPVVLGVHATDLNTGLYTTWLYAQDDEDFTLLSSGTSSPLSAYLPAAGTYYIRVRSSAYATVNGVADQSFTVRMDTRPVLAAPPVGSFVVNDDATYIDKDQVFQSNPATVWSFSTGELLGYLPTVPASEHGTALPSGESLWSQYWRPAGQRVVLLDANAAFVAYADPGVTSGSDGVMLTNNGEQFYIIDTNYYKIYAVNKTTGAQTLVADFNTLADWSVGGAVSLDGTKMYFISGNGVSPEKIHAWDLVNDVQLSSVTISGLADTPTYWAITPFSHLGDVLMMADGSIVTWYRVGTLTGGTYHLVHIDPTTGTVLHDHSLASVSLIDHITHTEDDATDAILLWRYTDTGKTTAVFERFVLSTGAQTTIVPSQTVWGGMTGPSAPTSTTVPLFGVSSSCDMMTAHPADVYGALVEPTPDPVDPVVADGEDCCGQDPGPVETSETEQANTYEFDWVPEDPGTGTVPDYSDPANPTETW